MKQTAVLARQSGSPAPKRARSCLSHVQGDRHRQSEGGSAGWGCLHGVLRCNPQMCKCRSLSPENR